jgi:phage terminase small subunit
MRYKTPIEIRSSQNIRVRVKLTELPEKLRCRIPAAEWLEDAQSFDRGQFIAETTNFIDSVYAIEPQCYETIILMLADAMQNYLDCEIALAESGGQLVIGDKINPLVLMQFDLTKTIIKLMRELGLTPASRLPATPATAKTIYDLLPFGKPQTELT